MPSLNRGLEDLGHRIKRLPTLQRTPPRHEKRGILPPFGHDVEGFDLQNEPLMTARSGLTLVFTKTCVLKPAAPLEAM